MNRKIRAAMKLNLKNIKGSYIAVALTAAALGSQYAVNAVLVMNGENISGNVGVSVGWALWLLPFLAAVLIPAANFKRIVNLGGKRENFFLGSLAAYAVLSGAVSLAGTVVYCAADRALVNSGHLSGILAAPEIFGWSARGPAAAFLQQFAFLFLLSAFTHTLTAIQEKWYGWAADAAIVSIISVFTPIAPLRAVLAGFFRLILFSAALPQVASCLILAFAVYALSWPVLARKAV